jgi:hypothetical protein
MAMNMDYCKFENTLAALLECRDSFGDDPDALSSEHERKARKSLLLLCKQVADDFEDEIEELLEAQKQRRLGAQTNVIR